ncbi:AP2/ERF and B3 domain-containing transcription factor RAV1 [Spatholobus suberectus]|nr:AP2/ERF and B3 domain-containing transcription factor RAV1 [Spatholobus suberectus]
MPKSMGCLWLNTINEEDEASRAYDIVIQRFYNRNAITNFKPLVGADNDAKCKLLNLHSKSEIVNMFYNPPYDDELQQSKCDRRCHPNDETNTLASGSTCDAKAYEQLFEKMVTPSDVGKLNQLMIPKQHAKKH